MATTAVKLHKPTLDSRVGLTLESAYRGDAGHPRILSLAAGSIAAKAGLLKGDIVVSIGGTAVATDKEGTGLIKDCAGPVVLEVLRAAAAPPNAKALKKERSKGSLRSLISRKSSSSSSLRRNPSPDTVMATPAPEAEGASETPKPTPPKEQEAAPAPPKAVAAPAAPPQPAQDEEEEEEAEGELTEALPAPVPIEGEGEARRRNAATPDGPAPAAASPNRFYERARQEVAEPAAPSLAAPAPPVGGGARAPSRMGQDALLLHHLFEAEEQGQAEAGPSSQTVTFPDGRPRRHSRTMSFGRKSSLSPPAGYPPAPEGVYGEAGDEAARVVSFPVLPTTVESPPSTLPRPAATPASPPGAATAAAPRGGCPSPEASPEVLEAWPSPEVLEAFSRRLPERFHVAAARAAAAREAAREEDAMAALLLAVAAAAPTAALESMPAEPIQVAEATVRAYLQVAEESARVAEDEEAAGAAAAVANATAAIAKATAAIAKATEGAKAEAGGKAEGGKAEPKEEEGGGEEEVLEAKPSSPPIKMLTSMSNLFSAIQPQPQPQPQPQQGSPSPTPSATAFWTGGAAAAAAAAAANADAAATWTHLSFSDEVLDDGVAEVMAGDADEILKGGDVCRRHAPPTCNDPHGRCFPEGPS